MCLISSSTPTHYSTCRTLGFRLTFLPAVPSQQSADCLFVCVLIVVVSISFLDDMNNCSGKKIASSSIYVCSAHRTGAILVTIYLGLLTMMKPYQNDKVCYCLRKRQT